MIPPIRCLPSLIYQLSLPNVRDPLAIFKKYEGMDWKYIKAYQPMILFQNKSIQLQLLNWKQGKCQSYYYDYSTYHVKVMDGSLSISEIIGGRMKDYTRKIANVPHIHATKILLPTDPLYTVIPFSKVTVFANEPSTTLQLTTI